MLYVILYSNSKKGLIKLKCPNCNMDSLLRLEHWVCINCEKEFTWEYIQELEDELEDEME
jgi:ribosomal protein L37AE/L43A